MKRILIIDDDQDILDSIGFVLKQEGYQVETTLSPKDVFSLMQTNNPDLILLDICLNNYDGLQICKAIKSYFNTQNIPILILSSDSRIHFAQSHYNADGIIMKPFDIQSLLNKINEYLIPPQAEPARRQTG